MLVIARRVFPGPGPESHGGSRAERGTPKMGGPCGATAHGACAGVAGEPGAVPPDYYSRGTAMKSRSTLLATATAVALIASVSLGLQEKDPHGKPAEAGMTDEMPMPKPTKEHEWLKGHIGTWEANVSCPMMGNSKGTQKTEAFGSFTVKSEFQGEWDGKPFKGMSFMTYDPAKGKYVSTWCDDSMPGIFMSEGTVDASGKKLTMTGKGANMEGKIVDWTNVLEIKSPDEHTFTMYETSKGANDPSAMRIDYKRHK
jgi:hypothetical protein